MCLSIWDGDNIEDHPVQLADLETLHARLQAVDPDAKQYSNPCSKVTIPFAFLSDRLPADRFELVDHRPGCDFQYIGRESFDRVWEAVDGLQTTIGRSQIYIHGTMGYGKSHILAALACVLAQKGNQVIYLPDCREMLWGPLPPLQTALLCAFSVPSLSLQQATIRACHSGADLVTFYRKTPSRWYFIIDQMNAFDEEASNEDEISNVKKNELNDLLAEMTVSHYAIKSASANHKTTMHMQWKQTNDIKLSLMGGMSEVWNPLTSL
jgi:hypothetical protein